MPVHRRRFRQSVHDVQSDAIALVDLNRRPRHAAVESPRVDRAARQELGPYVADFDVEDLESALEPPGQIRKVGRDDWHDAGRRSRSYTR